MTRPTIGLLLTLTLSLLVAPLAPEAQPPTHVHRIGWLAGATTTPGSADAFPEGMHDLGYVEGQHLVMEYRNAAGQYERFPALAAELVRLPVDVLLVPNTPAALAAKHATTTVPIVMVGLGDPVGSGLVASLAPPGGNIRGQTGRPPRGAAHDVRAGHQPQDRRGARAHAPPTLLFQATEVIR